MKTNKKFKTAGEYNITKIYEVNRFPIGGVKSGRNLSEEKHEVSPMHLGYYP